MERDEWRGAVLGMVMGDGALYRQQLRDGTPCGNALFDLSHSVKQEPYFLHKLGIVQSIFDYSLKIRRRMVRSPAGKWFPQVRCQTRTHSRLEFIRSRVYLPEKRITPWVMETITEQGLAYWWMDDGHLHRGWRKQRHTDERYPISIAVWGTYGFPAEDVALLRDCIAARYGVRFNMNRHITSGYSLRVGGLKAKPFLDRLASHAVPCMQYKFPALSDSARHPEPG